VMSLEQKREWEECDWLRAYRATKKEGDLEKNRARARAYWAANKEKHRASSRAYQAANKVKCSAYDRAYYAAHRPEGCLSRGLANRGKKRSPATLAKMSAAHKGIQAGPKNPRWQGGISAVGYSWKFNDELKAEVRRRDGHRCQLCGVSQCECKRALEVHHVDYDKANSDPVNLVSLCPSCHGRTNSNREYWAGMFSKMDR